MSAVQTDFAFMHDGVKVFASISPCSWMYAGHGLQVQLAVVENAVNAESEFICDKATKVVKVTPAILAKAKKNAKSWVKENGVKCLQKLHDSWQKKNAAFAAEFAAEEARFARLEAARIKRMAKQGYTHRIVGWVHPAQGDDRQFEAYSVGAPSKATINKLLARSVVKTDYKVTRI